MDKSFEAGLTPRKRMATGDKDPLNVGDYGVMHMSKMDHDTNMPTKEKHLQDHERGARGPIDRNQANADHGPHR